jgi:hypothetical protein
MAIPWMDGWDGALDQARATQRSVFLFLHSPT